MSKVSEKEYSYLRAQTVIRVKNLKDMKDSEDHKVSRTFDITFHGSGLAGLLSVCRSFFSFSGGVRGKDDEVLDCSCKTCGVNSCNCSSIIYI